MSGGIDVFEARLARIKSESGHKPASPKAQPELSNFSAPLQMTHNAQEPSVLLPMVATGCLVLGGAAFAAMMYVSQFDLNGQLLEAHLEEPAAQVTTVTD